MDELDIILTEQLHIARASKKSVKRLLKIMPNDPGLIQGEKLIDLKIVFLESMIKDKKAKPKKRINIKRKIFKIFVQIKFLIYTIANRKK